MEQLKQNIGREEDKNKCNYRIWSMVSFHNVIEPLSVNDRAW